MKNQLDKPVKDRIDEQISMTQHAEIFRKYIEYGDCGGFLVADVAFLLDINPCMDWDKQCNDRYGTNFNSIYEYLTGEMIR